MLYLIDSSIYIFRAWFSIPDTMVDRDGRPVNAVYGFARFLCDVLGSEQPSHIAATFDESLTTSFRNEIYPAYKGNRELPPPELEYQLAACRQLAEAMGIACFADSRFEADDLVGSLAAQYREAANGVTIVSRDKDLAQLLADDDWFWDFAAAKRFRGADTLLHYGVHAAQIADLLALAGDSVDNIPGVSGIGRKTAVALLTEFGSLKELYESLDKVEQLSIRGAKRVAGLLEEQRDQAFMCQKLTQIALDAPVAKNLSELEWALPDSSSLNELLDRLGFGFGLRARLEALSG